MQWDGSSGARRSAGSCRSHFPQPTPDVVQQGVGVEVPLNAPERHQAIQGTAVEQVPADARGDEVLCPGCGGVLWKMSKGDTRYRCHTGHSFTAPVLLAEQNARRALETADLGCVLDLGRVPTARYPAGEIVLAANRDLPKKAIAKKIAASDYDEKVAAAVARTKKRIEAIVPEDQSADLEGWVDGQWDQEVQAASTEDFTASSETYTASNHRKGVRCKVFATQYTGNTKREVALPHRNLKFGRQPRVRIRRVSGGPRSTSTSRPPTSAAPSRRTTRPTSSSRPPTRSALGS